MLKALMFFNAIHAATIEHGLYRELQGGGTANVILTLKSGVSSAIEASITEKGSRMQKLKSLRKHLQANAKASQQEVMHIISNQIGLFVHPVRCFWSSNSIFVGNANKQLVQKLSALNSVKSIEKEIVIRLGAMEESNGTVQAFDATYGLKQIRVRSAWNKHTRGQGVIVGSIDSGVRGSHESLRHNFVGKNGWLNPYNRRNTFPKDSSGHGTHTLATIVGRRSNPNARHVGVAPGAKWIACAGCNSLNCELSALLECGDFMICPTDTNGKNPDCSKTPTVVSNSWGGESGEKWYDRVIQSWIAANIVPVFANGNSGSSGCRTTLYPGEHPNVISVGAIDINYKLAYFSSTGPAWNGNRKPDVVAPGVKVYSASSVSDTAYTKKSGTSMACPHVAGVVALIRAKQPNLSIDLVRHYLLRTTRRKLKSVQGNCGGISDDDFPNNMYGHGLVQANHALNAMK